MARAFGNRFETDLPRSIFYLSALSIEKIFGAHDMRTFDVEEKSRYSGSLRTHATPLASRTRVEASVYELLRRERQVSLGSTRDFCSICRRGSRAPKQVVELLDRGEPRQSDGRLWRIQQGQYVAQLFLPAEVANTKPGYVMILPWNLKD
jgi:hypothetical protein